MDFGFYVPTRGPMANMESYRALAERGEALGFAHIAVSDHIVIPTTIESTYPYTDTGDYPGGEACLEQLTLVTTLAAITRTARILTSVMVVPHRNPVVTAKMLATIDVLSGGRLTLGCGAGWMREEFEALGAPPHAERGRVTDEYLRVFKELWTSDAPSFEGAYCRFSDIAFEPKPAQKPHPPLWIGGESKAALRRVARLGDGWYPIGSNPRFPLDTVARYRAAVDTLHGVAEEEGRDPGDITQAFWAYDYRPGERERLDDGGHRMFTGAPQDIAGDIDALRDAGVRHLVVSLARRSQAETLEEMERFTAEVVPLVNP